jgi:hypothetical protein
VNIDGVRSVVDFEVIEIVDDSRPYPTLMGLECVSNISRPRHKSDQACKWCDERRAQLVEEVRFRLKASVQSDFSGQDSSKGTDQRLAGNRR